MPGNIPLKNEPAQKHSVNNIAPEPGVIAPETLAVAAGALSPARSGDPAGAKLTKVIDVTDWVSGMDIPVLQSRFAITRR
jgi:hypothetical protein